MSARFEFQAASIAGVALVQRKPIGDARGFFSRFYCAEEFRALGIDKPIAQINHTLTRARGTVRGLHFQHPPHAEIKLVSCLRGEIFDVAVDLRRGSPTFLRWHAERLSAENQRSLIIPEGCAHGFQTLTEDCELLYLHTAAHRPDAEGALRVDDPALSIAWPLPIAGLSERDGAAPFVAADFPGLQT